MATTSQAQAEVLAEYIRKTYPQVSVRISDHKPSFSDRTWDVHVDYHGQITTGYLRFESVGEYIQGNSLDLALLKQIAEAMIALFKKCGELYVPLPPLPDHMQKIVLKSSTGGTGISFDPSSHWLDRIACPVCNQVFHSSAHPAVVFENDADKYWADHRNKTYGWHFNASGKVEVQCGCGIQEFDPADLHFRDNDKGRNAKGSHYTARFGILHADWIGFYGSPNSSDEDVCVVYFGEIPEWVRANWQSLRSSEGGWWPDMTAISIRLGIVTQALTADPNWIFPIADIQNCLYQTVPELQSKLRYIPPAERDIAIKEAQCRQWLGDLARHANRRNSVALNLWAKRAGFIGLQLLALKWGQDAGYTKSTVAEWAQQNLSDPESEVEKARWLPPTDHGDHDPKRVAAFLNWVINLPASYTLIEGATIVSSEYGEEVWSGKWWMPAKPIFTPPHYERKESWSLGACPLCGEQVTYPDTYPTRDIWYSSVQVHPACMERVKATLPLDRSNGTCHLEFDHEGKPSWVKGDAPSYGRIEYAVWDAEWKLVTRTDSAPEDPAGKIC